MSPPSWRLHFFTFSLLDRPLLFPPLSPLPPGFTFPSPQPLRLTLVIFCVFGHPRFYSLIYLLVFPGPPLLPPLFVLCPFSSPHLVILMIVFPYHVLLLLNLCFNLFRLHSSPTPVTSFAQTLSLSNVRTITTLTLSPKPIFW